MHKSLLTHERSKNWLAISRFRQTFRTPKTCLKQEVAWWRSPQLEHRVAMGKPGNRVLITGYGPVLSYHLVSTNERVSFFSMCRFTVQLDLAGKTLAA